jgi:hypothetical protein
MSKPKKGPGSITMGGSLHLLVKPDGKKYWHFDYRYSGKAKIVAFGVYPATTLAEARRLRDEAKITIKSGKDPVAVRKADKRDRKAREANTFEAVAREWWKKQRHGLKPAYAKLVLASLEQETFPMTRRRV